MASDNGREVGEMRRRDRLAASLRENLKRRKIQQRGRAIENGGGRRSADNQAEREFPSPASGEHEV